MVGRVYAKIMEIESRLLPCGLHTVGVPPSAEEAIATLVPRAHRKLPSTTPYAKPKRNAKRKYRWTKVQAGNELHVKQG